MTTKQSERLIVKFIINQASQEEIELLTIWLEDLDNQKVFKKFLKTNYAIDYALNSFDISEAKKKFLQKIRQDKSIFYKRKIQLYFKYAAIFLVLVSVGYYFTKTNFATDTVLPMQGNNIVIKTTEITLQLENGEVQVINTQKSSQIANTNGVVVGNQKGATLSYSNNLDSKNLIYNILKVPFGKRFEVTLSDGTHVNLNAGTSLKYPVNFIAGMDRKVYLNGEAFFDVAKDKKHPFIVNNNNLDIKVLGTKFNMSAYSDDVNIDIVLVEGSVSMIPTRTLIGEGIVLKPGFKGSFNNEQGNISLKKVNTSIYTTWIQGNIVFRDASFDDIAKKLERSYDVVIIINNKDLAKQTFNATIEADKETIDDVLFYFNKVYNIKYQKVKNKIIIN